jgi:hypothetical protein
MRVLVQDRDAREPFEWLGALVGLRASVSRVQIHQGVEELVRIVFREGCVESEYLPPRPGHCSAERLGR